MSKSKIDAFFKPTWHQSDRPSLLSDQISPSVPLPLKIANKKRNYAQFHLELGQRDFALHRCAICGMMYAKGDEGDEKLHKSFHKEYFEGISFKGWKNEKVVGRFDGSDRIVVVQDDDSSVQKQKVKQVIKMVEKELGFGEGQVIHSLCKVYLYISSSKIVGCLVAEPIKKAHKVISNNNDNNNNNNNNNNIPLEKSIQPNLPKSVSKTMNFGKFNFKREVFRKCTPSLNNKNKNDNNLGFGAIICEEKGQSAILGFRAIWVAPAKRRKGIASRLLDSARKSFCGDEIIEICKCGFSPPTSAGKGLACNYSKTASFLVYKTDH